MNVLSLFDGISCGQIALNRAGIKYDQYFASEIDEDAINVTQYNYPKTTQLGSILNVFSKNLPEIDLLMGGSPCQSLSVSGNQEGFSGKSGLFYEWLRVFKEVKPRFFLLENVVMKKEWEEHITNLVGVQPILIDSADFSVQRRKRLYWTNIPVGPWAKREIFIKDIIEDLPDCRYEFVHDGLSKFGKVCKSYLQYDGPAGRGNRSQNYRAYFLDGKMGTLSYSAPHGSKILLNDGRIRKTTHLEHERLQTIPDNYTSLLAINKAKAAIGNGWTVDVIVHIFRALKSS